MAYVGGKRRPGERTHSHKPVVQNYVPSSDWTEDEKGHYLLVDLPDFKKEQVKLQAETSGYITVSGERLASDQNSIICFQQSFKLPPNIDIDQITGKFDSGLLCVTLPKRAAEKKPEVTKTETQNISSRSNVPEEIKQETSLNYNDENRNKNNEEVNAEEGEDHNHGYKSRSESKKKERMNSKVDSFYKEDIEKWSKEPAQFEWAMNILKKNKGIVLTAIVAFSLGLYVSRKFGSAAIDEAAPFD